MQSVPSTTETRIGGRVVFLIDESEAMRQCIAGGTKPKAESIATALNSLLNQLGSLSGLEVAVVGYRGDNGGADVGCRWGGPLGGRRFVATTELANAPLTVENRVRSLPMPAGGKQEETIRFPVWYVPRLGTMIMPALGYAYCRHLIVAGMTAETTWHKPPLLISFVGNLLPQQMGQAVERLQGLSSPGSSPLVFHVHLGEQVAGRPVLYPSSDIHLPPGPPRDLFRWSSVLPDYMIVALRNAQLPISPAARGMIYGASVADLIRLLSLVKTYAQQPGSGLAAAGAAAAEMGAAARQDPLPSVPVAQASRLPEYAGGTPAPRQETGGTPAPQQEAGGTPASQNPAPEPSAAAALLILVADRSVADPADEGSRKNWSRLQEQCNDLLTQVARRAKDQPLEVAVLTYGAAGDDSAPLRSLDGPLAGRQLATPADLAAGAMRVVEFSETMSNGVGGLITVNRKRSIYVDQPAAAAGNAGPALAAVQSLAASWQQAHPGAAIFVLHLGRGQFDVDATLPALDALLGGGAIVYHLVMTEAPQRSLTYPATRDKIDDPLLAELWQRSSPLASAERLAAEKRIASTEARGLVVNGKFDLLLEGLLDAARSERLAESAAGVRMTLRLDTRLFTLAKDPEQPDAFQDACCFDTENHIAAVADGVSSSLFSGPWAAILAEAVVADNPNPLDAKEFAAWLRQQRERWAAGIDTSSLAWFQKAKLPRGAFSTLLYARVCPREESPAGSFGGYRLVAYAAGDSCLFQIRRGELVRSFPLDSAEQFDADPIVLGSVDLKRDHLVEFAFLDEACYAGDELILCTDAVAEWAMHCYAHGDPPVWSDFWQMSEDDWRSGVAWLRQERQMRTDDATMLMLRVNGDPPPLPQTAEKAVAVQPEPAGEAPAGPEAEKSAPMAWIESASQELRQELKSVTEQMAQNVDHASEQVVKSLRGLKERALKKYRETFGKKEPPE